MADDIQPAEQLLAFIQQRDEAELRQFWRTLPSSDLVHAVSLMDQDEQQDLLALLSPEDAADLVDELPDIQAADILEDMPAEQAAAIVDELDSDEQVDVLSQLDEDDAEAILEKMAPQEASDVRRLSQYDPDTAGGLMITEYLSFPREASVADVLADLREHVQDYAEYDVRYVYVIADETAPTFCGTVRLKDMVLSPGETLLTSVLYPQTPAANVADDLDALEDLFDRESFSAAPVVDNQGQLVGVVKRSDVEEALGDRADKTMMRFGGIITGEELRTMPTLLRAARRLAFLIPTLILSAMAVSVIGAYEETIKHITALAAFLPLVAGLCGCSGNQAVAVSMRELALGVVKPADVMRVLFKELAVGLVIGMALGLLVFLLAWGWTGDPMVAIAIGLAIPVTIVVAVGIGGSVPLILSAMNLDPAMASGPIVTTAVDFCGFFTVLWLATRVLHL